MKKIIKYVSFVLVFLGMAFGGGYIGYSLFKTNPTEMQIQNYAAAATDPPLLPVPTPSPEPTEIPQVRITASTEILYEYHYLGDGKTETSHETAPYFLLDMTKDMIEDMFIDWEVIKFDSDQVIMRKKIEGKSIQHYIVGIQDGYIAVFYSEPVNGSNLKDITDTPLIALTDEEQQRLLEGIQVIGDEQLIKILEDYGS